MRPPRGRRALEEMGAYLTAKTLLFENTRYLANSPYKIRLIQKENLPKTIRQIVLHVRQLGFGKLSFGKLSLQNSANSKGQFAEKKFGKLSFTFGNWVLANCP